MNIEYKRHLSDVFDTLVKYMGITMGMDLRRPGSSSTELTIHTSNNRFSGEISMVEKGGKTIVCVVTEDGGEYSVPYESIEYFEEIDQEAQEE